MNKPKKTTKAPTVILDIDDTIFNFTGHLCFLFNRKHGSSISENDLKEWNFYSTKVEDVRGNVVNGKELRQFFLDYEAHGLYTALPPIRESTMAIDLIKKLGYKIILLTARDERFEKDTELSLLMYNIPYDEVIFNADKPKHINRLARKHIIVAFADDKFEYIKNVAETDKVEMCYLIEKTHNRNEELPEGSLRVRDLLEVVRHLPEVK